MREKEYLYWLFRAPSFGAVTIHKLYEHYGSFRTIYNMEGTALAGEHLISRKAAAELDGWKPQLDRMKEEYDSLSGKGIRFISVLDEEYPERLTHIYGNPVGLYVKGRLPDENIPAVAIIGARNCSSYGFQVARALGASLSREGIQIISGMALGVDGAGHEGALMAEGNTFAVLGSGVDVCYPSSHLEMYMEIQRHGGIISEFAPGTRALAGNFPMRNRIISGLSDLVVVVEARDKSGSLITAELALEQGKEVYAVPGMVTADLSRGCNQLIRQGAGIVTSPDDILEYFQIKREKMLKLREKNVRGLAKKEKKVYSCLNLQPKFIDQVAEDSGLPLTECMTILMELELKGYVLQPAGHYYVTKL